MHCAAAVLQQRDRHHLSRLGQPLRAAGALPAFDYFELLVQGLACTSLVAAEHNDAGHKPALALFASQAA